MRVTVQRPQRGPDQECWSVVGPHIHHPLRVRLSLWIIAERDICLSDISIGHHIVGCAVIENCCPFPRLRELMTTQHEGYLSSLQLEVGRVQFQALSKRSVCIL